MTSFHAHLICGSQLIWGFEQAVPLRGLVRVIPRAGCGEWNGISLAAAETRAGRLPRPSLAPSVLLELAAQPPADPKYAIQLAVKIIRVD